MMLRPITSTAALSTSTNPEPIKCRNDGMQRCGGGAVFGEINVNCRRPLILDVNLHGMAEHEECFDGTAWLPRNRLLGVGFYNRPRD
jgi:hypothetical protein